VNILLAIDQSDASRKAVDFVAQTAGRMPAGSVSVTLLHVIDSLPDFIVTRQSEQVFQQVAKEWSSTSHSEGERLLETHRRKLESAGIPGSALKTKMIEKDALPEARKVMAALTIIEEMKSGQHDVVCVGRRGVSSASGAFPGSVAEKVLREAQGTTVWVVD
jgi:nucleotide-binding universal stress UspA family protein